MERHDASHGRGRREQTLEEVVPKEEWNRVPAPTWKGHFIQRAVVVPEVQRLRQDPETDLRPAPEEVGINRERTAWQTVGQVVGLGGPVAWTLFVQKMKQTKPQTWGKRHVVPGTLMGLSVYFYCFAMDQRERFDRITLGNGPTGVAARALLRNHAAEHNTSMTFRFPPGSHEGTTLESSQHVDENDHSHTNFDGGLSSPKHNAEHHHDYHGQQRHEHEHEYGHKEEMTPPPLDIITAPPPHQQDFQEHDPFGFQEEQSDTRDGDGRRRRSALSPGSDTSHVEIERRRLERMQRRRERRESERMGYSPSVNNEEDGKWAKFEAAPDFDDVRRQKPQKNPYGDEF